MKKKLSLTAILTLVVIPVLYAALDRKIFKRAVADEVVQAGASPLGSAALLP